MYNAPHTFVPDFYLYWWLAYICESVFDLRRSNVSVPSESRHCIPIVGDPVDSQNLDGHSDDNDMYRRQATVQTDPDVDKAGVLLTVSIDRKGES